MRNKLVIGLMLCLPACFSDDTISEIERLNKEISKIDAFLESNPPDPQSIVVKDASGIRLVITELGTGTVPPNSGNNLKVAYTGRLFSNGDVFDSNDAYYLKISDNIINGWKIGLGLMTEGTKAKIYIPSGYAYGPTGQGSIPGNAILVFDIFLENVVPTQQQMDKIAVDGLAIDLKLEGNENVVTHESGLRYEITQIGSGDFPSLYSQVRINYKGSLFTSDEVFQNQIEVLPSMNFSSRVVNYVSGLVIGLQLLQEGGKAIFYVPSTLAFGPHTVNGVPANSILTLEVELLEVLN